MRKSSYDIVLFLFGLFVGFMGGLGEGLVMGKEML